MAQEDRTEKATPKRREQAREKGQVARSADAGGSLVLIAGLFGLSLLGPRIVDAGAESFRRILGEIAHPAQATSAAGLQELMHGMIETMAITVGPIAAICMITGVLAGVAQVGFHPSPKALKPDFRRINPISGMRNLLSPNLVFEALKAIAKVGRRGRGCGARGGPRGRAAGFARGHLAGRTGHGDGPAGNGRRPARGLRVPRDWCDRLRVAAPAQLAEDAHDQAGGEGRAAPVQRLRGGALGAAPAARCRPRGRA